ncbi:MAG: ATP-binding protein [Clostridiales bacterium]|nr:ATP-binding protein [Clostridiales bacterium]
MEYCKKIIIEKIQEQLDSISGNKLILRIENFEDAKFYLEIYTYCQELCKKRNIDFTAKITLGAWEKLIEKNEGNYEARELERLEVVDKKNRITIYRNEIVNNPKLVLFLGTEYAEDKAGLNELFLLNPGILEHKVKKQYSLMFEKYAEIIRQTDGKRLDHFYEELFHYVPKNLLHLSCIIDDLPKDVESFEDLMQLIFSRLYEDWGLPNIEGFFVSKVKEKGKIQVLDKASQFIRRSKLRTANEIKKAYQKIDKYKEAHPNLENEWRRRGGFSSFEEFEHSLREYISGKDISGNREKLCQMDFMFINEILDLKIAKEKTDTKKDGRVKLYEEPFLMLQQALLQTLEEVEAAEPDKMVMKVESIKLAGIYGDEKEEDTRQREEQYWNCICRYCGGLIPYINEKGYLGKEKNCNLITDTDIFQAENTQKLIEKGILTLLGGNNSLSKVQFQIVAKNKEEELGKKKFEWIFSEKEGWFHTFVELENEFFDNTGEEAYIPFGVLDKLESYGKIQTEEDFYHAFARREIRYQNLVEEFTRKYGQDYPEITKEYEELGKQFFILTDKICQNGFYYVLLEEKILDNFLKTYCNVGETFAATCADDCLIESYRLFVNAFLLSDNDNCVKKDLEVGQCVIPAYHPATLEKLKEKVAFLTLGINELYQQYFENGVLSEREIEEKICFYNQISYINSSIDLLRGKNGNLICQKMFGGYGIYSEVSLQDTSGNTGRNQRAENLYDENMDKSQFSSITSEAKVIIRYIKDYIRTFPSATGTLDIGVIHYDDLQPVIAAMHYIAKEKDWEIENINLYIYMPKEKSGGENYLSSWLEQYFDENSSLKFQIFLNYYKEEKELEKKMQNKSLDVVFLNHVLTNQEVSFSELDTKIWQEDIKFPMFFKPLPMYYKSAKREVEISQLQFPASKVHTKVMYKLIKKEKNMEKISPRVVKTTRIQEEKLALIEQLHQAAKWVICQDIGLDKHILFQQEKESNRYKIIGFSTGEGTFGEYNILVSAKEEMVEDLKQRIKRKLNSIFGKWREEQLEEAANHCVDIAKELNGSSLLKALNPEDEDIRNFLAYILTTEIHKKQAKEKKPECEIIISLDSYKHWFREHGEEGTGKLDIYPDFLQLTVRRDEIEKDRDIRIMAKLIECKLAIEKEKHLQKAKEQIQNGYEILKKKFDSGSTIAGRKYWFAQLYQLLVFEQINRANNEDIFLELSNHLLGILNGNFSIEWEGEIYTFWINRDSDKEEIKELADISVLPTKQVIFGQQGIKELLTGKTEGEITSFEPVFEEEELEGVKEDLEREELQEEESVIMREELQEDSLATTFLEKNEVSPSNNSAEIAAQKEEYSRKNIGFGSNEKVEILLGKSKLSGEQITWNYTNKAMANRHLLITGKSGQGKTYAIQSFLMEFAKEGIPIIIFDYTEGFTNKKLNDIFKEQLKGKIKQNLIKINKMPINPFLRQEINIHEILDDEILAEMSEEQIRQHSREDSVAVASRMASILCHVYTFGDQQYATIYQACKSGIDAYGDTMNFEQFRRILEEMNTKEAKTVLNKLTPFLDTNLFDTKGTMDWSEMIYNDGMVNVIQLTQIPRDMQIVATEFILWDMWYYSLLHGEESKPFIVVLDEAQNLDFGEKSPSNKILTEGRKFGWSGWFATQFLKGQLKEDEIGRLQQTSQRIYFRPPDNEITSMAASIDQDRTHAAEWVNKLKKLQKGNCIVAGDSIFGEHGQKLVPLQISVNSMEERVNRKKN